MVFTQLIVSSVFIRGADASGRGDARGQPFWPAYVDSDQIMPKLSSGDRFNNVDSGDENDEIMPKAEQGKGLGMPAPQMGGLGDPCRGDSWSKCDWWNGLSCHLEYHQGSWVGGTCQYGSMETGGAGQQCRSVWSLRGACDNNCTPQYIPGGKDTAGWFGRGEGCYCERLLGAGDDSSAGFPLKQPTDVRLGAGLESLRDATQLGMPAPIMGGYGQPCRTSGQPCNYGLKCFEYSQGTSTGGFCYDQSNPNWVAQQGDKCGEYANPGQPQHCAKGLYCKHEQLLGTANAGWTATCQRHTPPPPQKAQEGQLCGDYAPWGKPSECADGLFCKTQKLLGTANAGYTSTCVKKPEPKAQEGQVCGAYAPWGKPSECADGLFCKTQKLLGTANAGYTSTCVKKPEQKHAQLGDRCGASAYSDEPTECEHWLTCRTDRRGGVWVSTCQH